MSRLLPSANALWEDSIFASLGNNLFGDMTSHFR